MKHADEASPVQGDVRLRGNYMHYAETKYGFEWACAKIQRIFSDKEKGWITLGIETPKFKGHKGLQVYITKTGKVRIFDPRGEWKQPNAAFSGSGTTDNQNSDGLSPESAETHS